DCFAGPQNCYLIKKATSLTWHDITKMTNVIGILETMSDKIGTLTQNCLADFARSLTGNDQRQAEFSSFFSNSFKRLSRNLYAPRLILTRGANIIMRLLQHDHPGLMKASIRIRVLSKLQKHSANNSTDVWQYFMRQHGAVDYRERTGVLFHPDSKAVEPV